MTLGDHPCAADSPRALPELRHLHAASFHWLKVVNLRRHARRSAVPLRSGVLGRCLHGCGSPRRRRRRSRARRRRRRRSPRRCTRRWRSAALRRPSACLPKCYTLLCSCAAASSARALCSRSSTRWSFDRCSRRTWAAHAVAARQAVRVLPLALQGEAGSDARYIDAPQFFGAHFRRSAASPSTPPPPPQWYIHDIPQRVLGVPGVFFDSVSTFELDAPLHRAHQSDVLVLDAQGLLPVRCLLEIHEFGKG